MSFAAATAPTIPGVSGVHSAETLYILEEVEPEADELNVWADEEVFPSGDLLMRSLRPYKASSKRINDTNFLFYQSGRLLGGFDGSVTTLASHQARRACSSRFTLRKYLEASALPVPDGRLFPLAQFQSALDFQESLGEPVNLRLLSGRTQRVFGTGLATRDQLAYAWNVMAAASSSIPTVRQQVLVERHYQGLDIRLYAVGEEISAALVRLPTYVVGDGRRTVKELMSLMLKRFEANAYLRVLSINLTETFLSRWDISMSHKLSLGEILPLSETASSSPGEALTVDVTHSIAPELKQLAVDAMWAFPGLSAASVDVRAPNTQGTESAVIVGVDPAGDVSEFRYPTYGRYRRVSMDILRHMAQIGSP